VVTWGSQELETHYLGGTATPAGAASIAACQEECRKADMCTGIDYNSNDQTGNYCYLFFGTLGTQEPNSYTTHINVTNRVCSESSTPSGFHNFLSVCHSGSPCLSRFYHWPEPDVLRDQYLLSPVEARVELRSFSAHFMVFAKLIGEIAFPKSSISPKTLLIYATTRIVM
jgi:hypothetical protein